VYTYSKPEDINKALRDSEESHRRDSEAAALVSVATDLSAVSVKDEEEPYLDVVDEDLTE
jgi:hypothetical protein